MFTRGSQITLDPIIRGNVILQTNVHPVLPCIKFSPYIRFQLLQGVEISVYSNIIFFVLPVLVCFLPIFQISFKLVPDELIFKSKPSASDPDLLIVFVYAYMRGNLHPNLSLQRNVFHLKSVDEIIGFEETCPGKALFPDYPRRLAILIRDDNNALDPNHFALKNLRCATHKYHPGKGIRNGAASDNTVSVSRLLIDCDFHGLLEIISVRHHDAESSIAVRISAEVFLILNLILSGT